MYFFIVCWFSYHYKKNFTLFFSIIFKLEINKINSRNLIKTTNNSEFIKVNKLFKFLYPNNLNYLELQKLEDETWHWLPYKRLQYFIKNIDDINDYDDGDECKTDSGSDSDVPESIFTRKTNHN